MKKTESEGTERNWERYKAKDREREMERKSWMRSRDRSSVMNREGKWKEKVE